MSAGDSGQPGPGDVVQLGRSTRLRPRWVGTVLLVCLVAAAAVVVATRASGPRTSPSVSPVTVRTTGHPILGIRAGYELFGLDGDGLVAVQFGRGRIVSTRLPPLQGDGIVSLVAARGEVLVRPLDRVPGYAVPDGKPARPLTGTLGQGGLLLPGPSPTEQWLVRDTVQLVGVGGKVEHLQLPTPVQMLSATEPAIADGRGGLVIPSSSHGVYDVTQGALRLVDALLLATGPRYWLGLRCSDSVCSTVVIDAATGSTRILPGTAVSSRSWSLGWLPGAGPWPWQSVPGTVAPDGSAAAVIVPGDPAGHVWLALVNLKTGAASRVRLPVSAESSNQTLAWSPDSRWLFVITASGRLAAVDASTGQVDELRLGLSDLRQLVIRSASG